MQRNRADSSPATFSEKNIARPAMPNNYRSSNFIKELCALFFKIRTEALRCSVDHSRRKDATQFVPTQCKYYRFSLHTQHIDLCRHHIRMLTCYISMPDQASSNASGFLLCSFRLSYYHIHLHLQFDCTNSS